MEKFLKFLVFLFVISLIGGQLTRFELGEQGIAFYLHDAILVLLLFTSFIYFFAFRKKFLVPQGAILVIIFILLAAVSQLNALRFFRPSQIITGSLFIGRFAAFFALYLIFFNLVSKKQLSLWVNLLIITGLILALLGFLQLIFFYDLKFLAAFGYDPHIGRLVSTFLDPNFFGGFQVIVLNLAIASFLEKGEKRIFPILVILFISIILTFSRSSYLALFISILLFGILKSKKLAIAVFGFFFLLTPAIPRILERILGAVTLDITASARIGSWIQALEIFLLNPVLGVGFNNLRFAKAKLGFFEVGKGLEGHAGAGVDSSFLQVLSTTGILGLLTFLAFYFYLVFQNFRNRNVNFYSLATFVSLVALFFHSQFVNSLFFPWIATFFWIKIALSDVANTTQKT